VEGLCDGKPLWRKAFVVSSPTSGPGLGPLVDLAARPAVRRVLQGPGCGVFALFRQNALGRDVGIGVGQGPS
jgi:hypothetical protein